MNKGTSLVRTVSDVPCMCSGHSHRNLLLLIGSCNVRSTSSSQFHSLPAPHRSTQARPPALLPLVVLAVSGLWFLPPTHWLYNIFFESFQPLANVSTRKCFRKAMCRWAILCYQCDGAKGLSTHARYNYQSIIISSGGSVHYTCMGHQKLSWLKRCPYSFRGAPGSTRNGWSIDTIAYGTGLETAHIPSNLRGHSALWCVLFGL